jgi:Family of unknown function (DUF6518)
VTFVRARVMGEDVRLLTDGEAGTEASAGAERRLWLVSVVVGVGLGVFSQLADGIIGGRLFGLLGNIASPWGLAAFFVGRLTTSPKRGAAVGALTLVVGVAVYYLFGALRGYDVGAVNLVWTSVALVAGPAMGWSGAAISAEPERPPVLAVAAPAAILVAEALFLAIDRRIWRSNLAAETYRLIDLGVMVALVVGGLVLPLVLEKDRRRRRLVYVVVALAGVGGALAFVGLREFISRIA